MKKFVSILMLFAMAISLLCVSAFAANEDTDLADSDIVSDLAEEEALPLSRFEADATVTNDEHIDGIFFAAGNEISAKGHSEYVIAAGNQLNISGAAEKEAVLAGRVITIGGTVGRDVYVAGQDVIIDGTVERNVYAAAQTVTVNGSVAGDLYLSARTVTIADSAVIGGQLHCDSDTDIVAPEALKRNADIHQVEENDDDAAIGDMNIGNIHLRADNSVARTVAHKIVKFLGVVAVAMVILWLTPLWNTLDRKYYGADFGEYAKAFGIGWGVLAAVPLGCIILAITGVGLRIGFIIGALYSAVISMAPVFISFFLGMLIWRNACKKQPRIWLELIIGAAVWIICTIIPGLKFAVSFVTVPLGLGVMMLLLCGSKKASAPQLAAAPSQDNYDKE